jgi:ribosomal protein S18 acetylase RimI-like enzyme
MAVHLRWLAPGDEQALVAASELFDGPVTHDGAVEFLARPGHHLCLAEVDGAAAGFVSGVGMTHPDKGTEMFLYELGVGERFRGRGLATALVDALRSRAVDRGCYGMWVLTDVGNEAASRTYAAAGATDQGPSVMLDWEFRR